MDSEFTSPLLTRTAIKSASGATPRYSGLPLPLPAATPAHAVPLRHMDELVAGLLLVDQARLRAHDAGRDRHQHADPCRDDEPAAAEQGRPREREEQGCGEHGAPRPDRRDQDEGGQKGPEQAAG